VGTGRGAQLGVLIKGPQVLEDTRRVDVIGLDKTGTLTLGEMKVVSQTIAPSMDTDELLRMCAAVEATSVHPIAQALAVHCSEALGDDSPSDIVHDVLNVPGQGVEAAVDGHRVLLGRMDWVVANLATNSELPEWFVRHQHAATCNGWPLVAVAVDGHLAAAFSFSDTVNPTAAETVSRLRSLGIRPMMLTGDHRAAALRVASQVGIDDGDVYSDLSPEDKLARVRSEQAAGAVVAMLGDGINDAAALATADLGIAMNSGSDAAINASDVTVVGRDLSAVPTAIRLARRTLATIKQNLWWAFGYNLVMLPLAIAGYLSPLLAGAAMAASSTIVVTNSLRLRKFI
jgi:Cu+-exporting ATPase